MRTASVAVNFNNMKAFRSIPFFILSIFIVSNGFSQKLSFKDPVGDDKGPGTYIYPTDMVYKKGSFDITAVSFDSKNGKLEIKVTVNSQLEDAWRYGVGFSTQMLFVFIDTDGKEGSGFTTTPPGLNLFFEKKYAWEKCIIISPQTTNRLKQEVSAKVAADMQASILIPTRTKGIGSSITAVVEWPENISLTNCSFQVVMQSNEGFPTGKNLLTKPVNEYEAQHRFGGGNDGDCDPHVLDILAGSGTGDEAEIKDQYRQLQYECKEDGSAKKPATIGMVKPK